VSPRCEYQEHTPDVEDNQLVAWTLFSLASSAWCGSAQGPVRQALRQMGAGVALHTYDASACVGRLYHRLNEDYGPLHALCRFFLANSGPACHVGDWRMVPFLVGMPALFETFVAEWLARHGPASLRVDAQKPIVWDAQHNYRFRPDVILRDPLTRAPVCVLDTKYKLDEAPKEDDVSQVVTYALALGCDEAILIYPFHLASLTDAHIGHVHVRTLGFPLDGDLDAAGHAFAKAFLTEMAIRA
jgi:5-methylcytosine-specific restriction enzyme subunit McrC